MNRNNQYQTNYYNNNYYQQQNWKYQYTQQQNTTNLSEYNLLWHDKEDFYTTIKAFAISIGTIIILCGITYIFTDLMRLLIASIFLWLTYIMYLVVIFLLALMMYKSHLYHKDLDDIQTAHNAQSRNNYQYQQTRYQPMYYNYNNR